ncbi:O-antigen ligase family protein [Candidatus Omnitrophota bacterium]
MQVFTWLAILCWITKKIALAKSHDAMSTSLKKIGTALLVFFAACSVSTLLSLYFGLSLKALLTKVLKNMLILVIVSESVSDRRVLRHILFTIIFSSILVTLDAFIQYFHGSDFLRCFPKAPDGLRACFRNRNGFGGWIMTMLSISLGMLFSGRLISKRTKKIIFVILVALLFCLGLTQSRASWFGFLLGLGTVAYFFLYRVKSRPKTILLYIAIIAALTFLLPSSIKTRLTSSFHLKGSILFRANLWKESINVIEDFPLFGAGLNTYSKVGPYYTEGRGGYYPHNSYLHMTAEIGIVGLFCFLGFIFRFFDLGLKVFKKSNDFLLLGFLGAILALLGQSLFDVNFYALKMATLFWFVLGLAMARISMLNREKQVPA